MPCRVPTRTAVALEPLLDPEVHQVATETAPVLTSDGLMVPVEHRGAVHLLRVPLDGGAPEP